jgi:hypothetical protein
MTKNARVEGSCEKHPHPWFPPDGTTLLEQRTMYKMMIQSWDMCHKKGSAVLRTSWEILLGYWETKYSDSRVLL